MDGDDVYAALRPHCASGDVHAFVAAFERIVAAGLTDQKAADMVGHQAVEIIASLAKASRAKEAHVIVRAYLQHAVFSSASPKSRQYFAAFALDTLEDHLELADEVEAKLLQDDVVDVSYGRQIVAGFAARGLRDQMMSYLGKTMDGGASLAVILANKVLKQRYDSDAEFRALADDKAREQAEHEAAFARTPDPDDVEAVLAAAKAELTRREGARPRRIRDVARWTGHHGAKDLLEAGFDALRGEARRHASLINHVLFAALVQAIARFEDPSLAPTLVRELDYVSAGRKQVTDGLSRHYELVQVAGTIALALAALDYRGDLAALDRFLASYEWRYPGEDFVMQARYAKWMMTGDPQGALAFVNDAANTKGLAYAACALADLHWAAALEPLRALLPALDSPVAAEAVMEAISRLATQTKPPDRQDRMIWLFGEVTKTEQALGSDSDDRFLLRARQRAQDRELGVIHEVDDSAPEER